LIAGDKSGINKGGVVNIYEKTRFYDPLGIKVCKSRPVKQITPVTTFCRGRDVLGLDLWNWKFLLCSLNLLIINLYRLS